MNRLKLNMFRTTSQAIKTELDGVSKRYDYHVSVYWPSNQPFNPDCEWTGVIVNMGENEFTGQVTTTKYLEHLFEKNKKTKEHAQGSYFPLPDKLLLVERIDAQTLVKSIDDLIERKEFDSYFHL